MDVTGNISVRRVDKPKGPVDTVLPIELKTGKKTASTAENHRGQVLLYSFLKTDRYPNDIALDDSELAGILVYLAEDSNSMSKT